MRSLFFLKNEIEKLCIYCPSLLLSYLFGLLYELLIYIYKKKQYKEIGLYTIII